MTGHGCAICGLPVCDECDRGSRYASACEEHKQIRIIDGWAEAGRTTDEVRATVTAEALKGEGFDAVVLSQKDHANVVGVGGLAVVRILVPAHQWLEARASLKEAGELDSGVA